MTGTTASHYRMINADREEQPYDAHWTEEYRARIKVQADREWEERSKRYDALRNPLADKRAMAEKHLLGEKP